MLKEMRRTPWQQQLALFIAFNIAYLLMRNASLEYWRPHFGLCFGAVLLLPRRFWPSLLLASVVALIPSAIACFGQYGWTGALIHLFPLTIFAALMVWPCRAHLPGALSGKRVIESVTARHVCVLLACTTAFAVFAAVDSTVQMVLTAQRTFST